jgi:murein DD-endopeptidase
VSRIAPILVHQLRLVGKWYRYGGKGPEFFDCSGFITYPLWLATGLDYRATCDTDRMWLEWERLEAPETGCVALFGGRKLPDGTYDPKDVEHVMSVLTLGPDEPDLVIGTTRGGRDILTLDDARKVGARVDVFRFDNYRNDFRGYRRLPLA